MITLDQIDLTLHEIGSMVEFAHRVTENMTAGDDGTFCLTYDSMNLLDFAICDLEKRVKELRENIQAGPNGQKAKPAKASVTVLRAVPDSPASA
jgi:hypothetical protein